VQKHLLEIIKEKKGRRGRRVQDRGRKKDWAESVGVNKRRDLFTATAGKKKKGV